MRKLLLASFAVTLNLTFSASAQDRPVIVVDHYALAWMTEQLVGSGAEVRTAAPENVDPSFWRPSPADISAIQQADLIVLNGADFSKWPTRSSLPRSKVIDSSAKFRDELIETDEVTHSHGADGEHSHTATASYTWLDFELASVQAETVAEALKRKFPEMTPVVESRLKALLAQLDGLDQQAITIASRSLVVDRAITTHPRYQYLGRAYGLEFESLEWDAGAMPSEEQWVELGTLAEANNAQILIWERMPPKGALERAEALGLRSVVFDPLAIPPLEGDFVSVMSKQLQEISSALNP